MTYNLETLHRALPDLKQIGQLGMGNLALRPGLSLLEKKRGESLEDLELMCVGGGHLGILERKFLENSKLKRSRQVTS